MARFDLAVVNGTLVIPFVGTLRGDVGARDGKIVQIADKIAPVDADVVVDAQDKLVFPGAVDAHFHIGIYRPVSQDAESETMSALVGGVTSVVSYFRTGSHYLNKTGPYREILPEVLAATAGHAYTDYGFHIAVMTSEQVGEVDWLVQAGIGSFKYYMFYKGLNLAASSTDAASYTMSDVYDLGHLYRFMQAVSAAHRAYSHAGRISLSIHCEHAEIIRTMIDEVKATNGQAENSLEAYSRARPPFQERLAIAEATVLADVTGCPINLLHLSSGEALEGGKKARLDYPDLDVQLETTLHHLALTYDQAHGVRSGKVNPPIRTRDDVEALWGGIMRGDLNQVVSDHACCKLEMKQGGTFPAQPGFGGTSLLYPVLFSEGYHKRRLPLHRVAELVSAQPARNFGLFPRKGTIAVGVDADLTVLDPNLEAPVTVDRLLSAQDHTPFDGFPVTGWPTHTIRAGRLLFDRGTVVGTPDGQFLKRPVALHDDQNDGWPAARGELTARGS